ncbi:UNVERIFIED_CONTAM: hypothetical protein GTU68_015992, partial [Idotea baltica]|nr:hypothetical protein [Idotea baltica]
MFGQSSQNTNKPICQFYQRGNCKHGNNCWNLHPGGSNGLGTSSNVFGGNSSSSFSNFGNNNANLQIQDKEFLEFVKQVGTEMTVWEEKGLWLLSCLAPLRDHPLLVGFTDTSPEELRVEAYEALKTNSSASYQSNYNQKLEFHKQLRQALKSKLPEAIEALKAVFYKSGAPSNPGPTSSATKSLFGKPASSSFLGAAASSSATPSLFGGSNSSSQTASVFGGGPNLGGG